MDDGVSARLTATAFPEPPPVLGVWLGEELGAQPARTSRATARAVEALGFGVLWISESVAKEALSHAALLLGATESITIGTGIASLWARDPTAMMNGGRTLVEAHPGRLILGLGVSHEMRVRQRGHDLGRPLAVMAEYLEAMGNAPYEGPVPEHDPVPVIAALGPKMLELAAKRSAGALTYLVPPIHTSQARASMGTGVWLGVEQAILLEDDPGVARQVARRYLSRYLQRPNYTRNLQRLGWDPRHFADGGSDDLVDALVAWGDEALVEDRVRQHLVAGADHVCIQPLRATPEGRSIEQLARLTRLAEIRPAGSESVPTAGS